MSFSHIQISQLTDSSKAQSRLRKCTSLTYDAYVYDKIQKYGYYKIIRL